MRVTILASYAALAVAVQDTLPQYVLFSADCDGATVGTGECIYQTTIPVTSDKDYELVHTATGKISALATDTTSSQVFWTDRTNEELWVADLSDFTSASALQTGLGEPHDIVILDASSTVYFADKTAGKIYYSTDGGVTIATFIGDLNEPVGLAYDSKNGHFYVADYGDKAIYRYDSSGDASSMKTFQDYTTGLAAPRTLLVDDLTETLYWVEVNGADSDSISSGSVRSAALGELLSTDVTTIASNLTDPDCIVMPSSYELLITDEDNDRLYSASLANNKQRSLLHAAGPRALAVYTQTAAFAMQQQLARAQTGAAQTGVWGGIAFLLASAGGAVVAAVIVAVRWRGRRSGYRMVEMEPV